MLTVYVLKNRVGRYNIFFFNFYTKLAESSFLCRFRVESVNVFVLPWFDLSTFSSSTISHMRKRFPEWVHSQVVWILRGSTWNSLLDAIKSNGDIFPSFYVFTYLCMILLKMSTAISIKHRILATFSINKIINSDRLYAFIE
jgi:hypothetical protein